jgi:hypothetical protein
MNWAQSAIDTLARGERTRLTVHGNSMRPKVESGSTVTLLPIRETPAVGAIVLCTVRGRTYLHLVKAVRRHGNATEFQIGNNRGGLNGWCGRAGLHGVLVHIDPPSAR